jgi:hypothetical protein
LVLYIVDDNPIGESCHYPTARSGPSKRRSTASCAVRRSTTMMVRSKALR